MRPFTSTISIGEARRRLAAGVRPVEVTERVPLSEAGGRVAAEAIASSIAVPPFSRSAMDGYAVVAADTVHASKASPVRLRVIERIFTGGLSHQRVLPGTCAEIATGAPMPDGADAVVMVEDTSRAADGDGGTVEIVINAAAGQNIGRKGADISAGDIIVRAGDWLNPSRLGALAAIGRDSVAVYRRPRVAVLSTGNEVVDPGMPLEPGQIYDVNRFTLGAVIAAHGGVPVPHPPVGDSLDALMAALDACQADDLIIFSGGSSVGERDLIVDLVAARGEMIFHGIAVRPGKPTAFARINGKPFFGMPGNPTSCLSNAYILLVPFLRATARLPVYAPKTVRARIGRRIESVVGRHQFYTVKLNGAEAMPAFKGSGEITSLSQADGYIEIPEDQSVVEKDTEVDVVLL